MLLLATVSVAYLRQSIVIHQQLALHVVTSKYSGVIRGGAPGDTLQG